MDKMRINLEDLLICMSKAQDIMFPQLSNHHQQVAYLSYRIAEVAGLPAEEQRNIYLAALIHDIGALSLDEKLEIIENDPESINKHAIKGAKLLENFAPLKKASQIIKFHHIEWENGNGIAYQGEAVPFASHIIHIADRVCSLIRKNRNIISQIPDILAYIDKMKGIRFVPGLVNILIELGHIEYIWFDLISEEPIQHLRSKKLLNVVDLEIDEVVNFALIFSQIIDFRSQFTARHSAGVAKTAEALAKLAGFSEAECKKMLIAGYLHDVGKLAIRNEILEKPDKLTEDEFNEMRSHTYYTYQLLSPIEAFDTINKWASFHHEKLDGSGYPFHVSGDELTLGCRIMAVADVFTAITEDRPYRKSMEDSMAIKVLAGMVKAHALDADVVTLLIDNFQFIKEKRERAQLEESEKYREFINA